MFSTVYKDDFCRAFKEIRPDNFTPDALDALFNYFEELEESGVKIELDVIAICCEYTEYENVLTVVDSHDEVTLPSAADLPPDGSMLAVLTYTALWVFEKPASGDQWFSGRARRVTLSLAETKQAEAVCWDDPQTLRLANEQREIFRVKLSSLRPVD